MPVPIKVACVTVRAARNYYKTVNINRGQNWQKKPLQQCVYSKNSFWTPNYLRQYLKLQSKRFYFICTLFYMYKYLYIDRRNSILVILPEAKNLWVEAIITPICKESPVLYEIHYCHSYGMFKSTILTLEHYVIGVTTSCHQFWLVQERRNSTIWSYVFLALKYQTIFICLSKLKIHVKYPQEMMRIAFCVSYERLQNVSARKT